MALSSDRPRVSDLVFQVYGKAIHPDWFPVRDHRRVVHELWQADVFAIERGHAVVWKSDRVRITEVLAPQSLELPESGLLFHSSLKRERTARIRPAGGVEYQAGFEAERTDAEVFAHTCDELILDASRAGICIRSGSKNRLVPAPLTYLHFETCNKGLLVHTFHSFPDERAIVRTQSLFESRVAVKAV